jgi:hypothetical protein
MQITATDTSTSPSPDKAPAVTARPVSSNRASLIGALAVLVQAQTIAADASGNDSEPGGDA